MVQLRRCARLLPYTPLFRSAGAGRGVDVVGRIAAVEGPPVEDSGTGEVEGGAGGRVTGGDGAAACVVAGSVGVGATGQLGRVLAESDGAAVSDGRVVSCVII